MKAYKFEVVVIDFEGRGPQIIADELEDSSRCINPILVGVCGADIGEWCDEHPLNMINTPNEEILEYFNN